MSSLLVTVPVITTTYADACMESVKDPASSFGVELDDVLLVDNSRDGFVADRYGLRTHRDPDGHNLGVAGAWNVGAREVLERDLDYFVIMSSVMLFGPKLHCTWLWQMEQFWGETVIEADGHSWHLIALHRRVLERVGLFDENFYPAYEESIDYGYRMRMLRLEHSFRHVWVNAISQAAGGHSQVVSCPNEPLKRYYEEKWGGPKGQEKWVQPYGSMPLEFWERKPIPQLAQEYRLKEWW